MPDEPVITNPPVADPTATTVPTPPPGLNAFQLGPLSTLSGPLLSEVLMFLQEVLQEYETTLPDWKNSKENIALMLTVRAALGAAEAAMTPPTFTIEESQFLQETLWEYCETHWDWRRRFIGWSGSYTDFDLMLGVNASIGADQLPPAAPTEPSEPDTGITSPPPADPYYTPPQPV